MNSAVGNNARNFQTRVLELTLFDFLEKVRFMDDVDDSYVREVFSQRTSLRHVEIL